MFKFIWEQTSKTWIVGLIFIVIYFAFLFFIIYKVANRKANFFILGGFAFSSLVLFFLDQVIALVIVNSGLIAALTIMLFTNIGAIRNFLSSPFHREAVRQQKGKVEKIYDREELYHVIDNTVKSLSKKKIGAIMTFEKAVSLIDVMKNGVSIHAPVSQELLETIFFPNTRLHDGAVIIHGNEIVAASVFFTPTTKAYATKYGSRHRAAIGISEICDAVTVVVSEETGKISFAINGHLETVEQNDFYRCFENYMDQENVSKDPIE